MANALIWALHNNLRPWKFQFYFNLIKELSHKDVVFPHEARASDYIADVLANQGVDRVSPWTGPIMLLLLVRYTALNILLSLSFVGIVL